MENMTHGRGLIKHHLREGVETRFSRLAELENTAYHVIPVVIA
jgi:hypothetical protein